MFGFVVGLVGGRIGDIGIVALINHMGGDCVCVRARACVAAVAKDVDGHHGVGGWGAEGEIGVLG